MVRSSTRLHYLPPLSLNNNIPLMCIFFYFHYVSYHIMIICTYHSHIHQMNGGTWGVSAGVPGHDDVTGDHVHGCTGEGYPLSLAKVCLSYRTLFYVRSFKSLKMIGRRLTEQILINPNHSL